MYDDLIRTQDAPFEHFVMTSIIPSLLITSFLNADAVWAVRPLPQATPASVQYGIICAFPTEPLAEWNVSPYTRPVRVGVAEVLAVEVREEGASFWQKGRWPALDPLGEGAPSYPEVPGEAGVEGRVVLEAVVDTAGHVEPGSLVAIATTDPGFVAAARRAVAATLFRPALVHGRAVRVRVRIPIEFTLRC